MNYKWFVKVSRKFITSFHSVGKYGKFFGKINYMIAIESIEYVMFFLM